MLLYTQINAIQHCLELRYNGTKCFKMLPQAQRVLLCASALLGFAVITNLLKAFGDRRYSNDCVFMSAGGRSDVTWRVQGLKYWWLLCSLTSDMVQYTCFSMVVFLLKTKQGFVGCF